MPSRESPLQTALEGPSSGRFGRKRNGGRWVSSMGVLPSSSWFGHGEPSRTLSGLPPASHWIPFIVSMVGRIRLGVRSRRIDKRAPARIVSE